VGADSIQLLIGAGDCLVKSWLTRSAGGSLIERRTGVPLAATEVRTRSSNPHASKER